MLSSQKGFYTLKNTDDASAINEQKPVSNEGRNETKQIRRSEQGTEQSATGTRYHSVNNSFIVPPIGQFVIIQIDWSRNKDITSQKQKRACNQCTM